MKKILLSLIMIFSLVGCSSKSELELPEVLSVSKVEVKSSEVNYVSEDSDWINILLTKLKDSSVSKIDEVIVKPSVDEVINISLTSGEDVSTLLVYEVDDVVYLEQSLRGSFEISEDTLTYILNGGN